MCIRDRRTTAHSLSVRPNPTDGHITIDVSLDNATIADLRIVAADGTTMQQLFRSNAAEGDHTFSANLTGSAAASYFIVLKTNEGMRYEKVVVK